MIMATVFRRSVLLLLSSAAICYTSATATADDSAPPGWVRVPGAFVRAECVHHVPKGALVDPDHGDVTLNGSLIAHFDPCSEPPINLRPRHDPNQSTPESQIVPSTGGWIVDVEEFITLQSGNNLDRVSGNWQVPQNPASNGATVFLFNGLEPDGQAGIIQPVLQWGSSAAGGGNWWGIASWGLFPDGTYISPLEGVNAGDTINGYTAVVAQNGDWLQWTINATDETTGAWTSQGVYTGGYKWDWAYGAVLEAYNVTTCPDFPGGSAGQAVFTNSWLRKVRIPLSTSSTQSSASRSVLTIQAAV